MYKFTHSLITVLLSIVFGFGAALLVKIYSNSSSSDRLRSTDEIEWIATCALIKGGMADCASAAQQLYDMNYWPLADGPLPTGIIQQ